MNDYLDPINAVGMPEKIDSAIALDLLLTVKEAIRNYSVALTETTSPELRTTLHHQMEAMIDFQTEVIQLMADKKWFHPYDLDEQQILDLKSAQNAIEIAALNLFPDNNNRKGLFPTPPK
ncbi:spore coat protein [Oceanobacillus luteolus]|uniref:Spore coat protein n=1 Tax=Oceanobacillus luteolus TaxID=1274358 RepID=A0ABW4HNF7_9BACI|nr:spore coat protein [Oceanobacillus luteolus]MCM3739480.1 spore coat protein [Oceanobacillus luteolus]